jgi:GTP-binding protein
MTTKKRSCVVSLIGRPNVGKSTIFNRIMRASYKAMTHDLPGVTRDRHYSIATVENITGDKEKDIILVDTGGFYPEKIETQKELGKKKTAEPFFNIMADHAKMAIEESDLVLMVVDVREGLLPFDKTISDYIRTSKKPMWLLVNKFDTDKQWGDEAEFYALGFHEEQFYVLSAEHNRGLNDLREKLFDFADSFETDSEQDVQKGVTPNHDVVGNVAIIGAPNAGKSTLLNQFLGAQRALVSNVAGTTVDPIEGYFDLFFGKNTDGMKVMKDQYRKTDKQLFSEFEEFNDDTSDEELLAYNEMPEDYKDIRTGTYVDEEDSEASEFSEEDFDGEAHEIFTVEDNAQSIDSALSDDTVLEVESSEVNSSEKAEFTDEEKAAFNPFRSVKLVDTAGIRRQKVVAGFIEEQSVYRSLKAISEADIVVFMIDVTIGITHQDRRLCDITLEKGKSLILVLNKIDLIAEQINTTNKKKEWLLDIRSKVPWLGFCELITISAKNGKHLNSLKESIRQTIIVRNKKITTGRLNKTVSFLVDKNLVVLDKERGTRFKVKYASMLKSTPPTFLLFTNKSKGIPTSYRKYLSSGIRTEFEMTNTPIHLIFRTATDIEKRMKRARAGANKI